MPSTQAQFYADHHSFSTAAVKARIVRRGTRMNLRTAFASTLLLALATLAAAQTTATKDLELIDTQGYQKILATYKGKPLVVTFWATWCEPCRDEYPMLVALAKQYAPKGLVVYGVSFDDNADMNLVRRFLMKNQPGFPNYRQRPGVDVDAFYRGV